MKAKWKKHTLNFINPAGTSRGVMKTRDIWYILLSQDDITGIGECAPLPGLSLDSLSGFEDILSKVCYKTEMGEPITDELLFGFPSIRFGIAMASTDLRKGGKYHLFDSPFIKGKTGLPINGLIWMGSLSNMKNQVDDNIMAGFNIIKIKVGAISFNEECELLKYIRSKYGKDIEIRLDANGSFSYKEAQQKLEVLSKFDIHSIEQPISVGQNIEMASLCQWSPIPIALDEELIPHQTAGDRIKLLEEIRPQYIIIKPTLIGGFSGSLDWIEYANNLGVGWWVTSALESNIGLNAIAQWTATLNINIPHGLGTGMLFMNNIESPLEIQNGALWYNSQKVWGNLS